MKKYFGILSYLGEGFYGFERQPELRTVQGVLEEKLSYLLNEPTIIKGAGRTDAGVSAKGQTFSFTAKKDLDVDAFSYSLNRLLPEDMVVVSLKEVDMDFDARHSSCGKVYRYAFSYGLRDPFAKGRVAQLQRKGFDAEQFKKALSIFVGTHDFSNFTSKPEDKDGFVRTIDSIVVAIDEKSKTGEVTFRGTHFMTYQIRMMLGGAFRVAYGKMGAEDLESALMIKPRKIFSVKAPAEGLCLMEVLYA